MEYNKYIMMESLKSNSESEEQKNKFEYRGLINDYTKVFNEIKKLERKSGKALPDPDARDLTLFLEKERHQIHLRLIELGSKLDKNKADVLIDLLSKEGGLEEYGLREFAVKNPEYLEDRKQLNNDEVLLIFDYTMADDGGGLMYSEDHNQRMMRAELLAKEIGGRFVSIDEGAHHESTETIGVAFPKEDLEKVAAIIRNNPKKFRLGEEFYKK